MDPDNPFRALLDLAPLAVPKTADAIVQKNDLVEDVTNSAHGKGFSDLAEEVFLLTLKKPTLKKTKLFYMKDLAETLNQDSFDECSLGQAVLEYCVCMKDSLVDYLFQCYERTVSFLEASTEAMKQAIFSNLYLAFVQPELFPEQKLYEDFTRTFTLHDHDRVKRYISEFSDFCQTQEVSDMKEVFTQLFDHLKTTLASQHLMIGSRDAQNTLLVMSSVPLLARAVLSASILNENQPQMGRNCELTVLGSLFTASCIPRTPGSAFDFFERPSQSPVGVHQTVESNIWSALERNMSVVHKVFYNLLKVSPEANNLTRTWIGMKDCLFNRLHF